MKKKIFKTVTVFATMLLVLSCLVTVFSKKVYADTTLPKVSGLTWDTTTDPEKFIGRWDAYNYDGFERYFVELYHNNVRINDEHGGARPGIVSTATSYDFTDIIKEGGPGEYTFIVRAYVKNDKGQSTWALEYTKSDMSDKFTYGTTTYKVNLSKSIYNAGRFIINNKADDSISEVNKKWSIDASESQNIVLEAFPYNGYRFTGWTSSDVNASNGTFVMPDKDVNITANFESFYYDPEPTWETEDSFKAKWAKYDGCQGYKVTLYESGYSLEKVGDTVTLVGDDKTSYDFSELVKASGKGIYTYGIQAYFVDGTTTETFTCYDYKRYGYVEVDRIDFTVDTSSITKFAEGSSYSDIKAELGKLQNTDKLISGYSDNLKLGAYLEHVRLTSTNTSAAELADDALIDAETTYYLCFPFAINKEKVDRYTDTVAVPSGTSLVRYGDTLVYVFYPIKLGTTPDPGPSPDPDPAPGPNPDPDGNKGGNNNGNNGGSNGGSNGGNNNNGNNNGKNNTDGKDDRNILNKNTDKILGNDKQDNTESIDSVDNSKDSDNKDKKDSKDSKDKDNSSNDTSGSDNGKGEKSDGSGAVEGNTPDGDIEPPVSEPDSKTNVGLVIGLIVAGAAVVLGGGAFGLTMLFKKK